MQFLPQPHRDGISARWEQGLFSNPDQEEEQHLADVGGVGCSASHPCSGEGYSTLPASLPLFLFAALKGTSFPHKEIIIIITIIKKICSRETSEHIKIQVLLSELENQVLYISL